MLEKSLNQEPFLYKSEVSYKKESSYDNNIHDLSGRGCQIVTAYVEKN